MELTNQRTRLESFFNNGNLYQRMVEEIQDYAIIVLDKKGYIQNWNKGAQKIKQYDEEEVLGQHFSIFYLPEDTAGNMPQRLLNEAEHDGRANHEGWRVRKDGTKFWGSITITAIHDDNNDVIGFCKVTRDLTDRRITEDRLRVSEERYHQMVAEVQDYAIILLGVTGIVENWNAGAEKIKGYKTHEIIGKRFEIFYPPADRQRGLPAQLLATAREAGRATHEGWRVRKDGTYFWGSITITALHNKEGEVIGFSKVTRDLTEKKLAEDKLAEYMSELEIQNRELEQFAYVASHDLQEPLRKIQTFSELVKDNLGDPEFVTRYMEKLSQSAKRMAQLITSLLDYSRLSKDRTPAAEVDLNNVLAETKQDFELLIEEKGAIINSSPLPIVKGHHSQLGQLFANLLSNALKFSSEKPVVNISAERVKAEDIKGSAIALRDEEYYKIMFEDNGIGFDEQYKELIFALFQRLHGKTEYAGTGIGLALCKRIVENHEGFITASSVPGKGASFCVYLPV